jgi:dipeptidyl aminopeptidase/acylaminoacyl peptidase
MLARPGALHRNCALVLRREGERATERHNPGLPTHPRGPRQALLSPDGKKISYKTTVTGCEQVFTMNADGIGQTQITHDEVNHDSPSWSPDGRKMAFVSDKGGGEASDLHYAGAHDG